MAYEQNLNTIKYIMSKIKTESKFSKEQGFTMCRSMLKEVCCRSVIIKVKDECKIDWFKKNVNRLKEYDPEIALDMETTFVAGLYQPIWTTHNDNLPILANSLGQRLRDEKIIEDISKYPIEWMMII